ncbi:Retrovirus-related Pol polyprotein from transposon TNT 1-94 [Araneus ventricosus]|uniref:Retrovirus-related Pol polyprotein from transposon TNT 1-94 n=1 Tax=Araneus ventricosus TaxID=182803 RepID=A0A4Y2U258_ARAVE|nr:Retrovirus-related Pol polyprotein from transposon TNT 1-94 [Araneus ventricosus]
MYTEKILQRFRIENSKALSPPCDVAKSQEGDPSMVDVPYSEAVGCLQYLAVTIRPNIAFAVVFASRALCKPTKDDWKHVERIYIYLRGTSNVGLLYKSHVQTEFSVSSDADHASDEKTRRSTSGMVSMNSCSAITWRSRLQHSVAISSFEAEYVAASEASNQLVWLKLLFKELFEYDGSPFLYVDN